MNIININSKSLIDITAKILSCNGIVIFPTDTVYGIGCALNKKAIIKLYKIKNRSLNKPTAILLSRKTVVYLRSSAIRRPIDDILKKYPKGKITIVANADNFKIKFPDVLLKNNKIGFRIPNDKWIEMLINNIGPIVASSANKAGEKPPKKFADIDNEILEQADLVIKSDKISTSPPSTVYDIEENKIIRM